MANHEIELQVAPMSDETMDYLDTLFSVCKRFNTDYYHATQKERDFIDAVASHEYQLKKARRKGPAACKRSALPRHRAKRAERSHAA